MKRVLVITYYWPPSGGSGVQRWLKTSKYLPEYGWEPVIYTPLNPDLNSVDQSLSRDVPPGLKVIKRKITEPYGFYKLLSGKKKGELLQANMVVGQKKGFIQRVSGYIRANWFIPDPRCWWIGPSVRFLSKRIRSGEGFDAVVSTGPPHSMHLIAMALHKRFNIPWLADFRDPWTKIFYFKHLGLSQKSLRKHKALERSVLEQADRVAVVSSQMKEDFSTGEYSDFAGKITVIPNGYDPADFSSENNPELAAAEQQIKTVLDAGMFVVVHTGLIPESANPDMFWKVLGDEVRSNPEFGKKLMIVTMGQTCRSVVECIAENGLSDKFKDLGYVPHATSVAWQKRADLLLLPLRKEIESKAILTGKFFEYLASGNRILAFGPTDGNLALELRNTGSGTICRFDDIDSIRKAFMELSHAAAPTAQQMEYGKQYSRIAGAASFAENLNQITKENKI